MFILPLHTTEHCNCLNLRAVLAITEYVYKFVWAYFQEDRPLYVERGLSDECVYGLGGGGEGRTV